MYVKNRQLTNRETVPRETSVLMSMVIQMRCMQALAWGQVVFLVGSRAK